MVVLPMIVLLPLLSVETIGLVVTAVKCSAPAAKMVVVPTGLVVVLPPDVMVENSVEVVMAELAAPPDVLTLAAEALAAAVRGRGSVFWSSLP
jgi:hypothetical protein